MFNRENIILRARILKLIREFFDNQGFIEVDTPAIVKVPSMEPYLDPFSTEVITIDNKKHRAYLITSPEYAMKELLVEGMDKIYQICKCFRNKEPWDDTHNPEFTMIEWYRTGVDYNQIIQEVLELIEYIGENLDEKNTEFRILNTGNKVQNSDFSIQYSDVQTLTVKQAMKNYADVDLDLCLDLKSINKVASNKGYEVSKNDTWDDVFYKIFLQEVEPNLGKEKIIILKDYPIQQASLSKKKQNDQRYAERFEIYLNGLEICNGFSELIDPDEQLSRLKQEQDLRKKLGKEYYDIDKKFIKALQKGMPESGGVALGVDRLVMLFTGAKSIKDINPFNMEELFK